jgi:hypothetical protein
MGKNKFGVKDKTISRRFEISYKDGKIEHFAIYDEHDNIIALEKHSKGILYALNRVFLLFEQGNCGGYTIENGRNRCCSFGKTGSKAFKFNFQFLKAVFNKLLFGGKTTKSDKISFYKLS